MISRPAHYEPLSTDDDRAIQPAQRVGCGSFLERRVITPVVDFTNAIWEKCASFVRVNAGLLLVAASQAFFAFMNVAVKKLNSLDPPVPALELVAVRMGITYICCLSYLLWRKVPDPILGPKGVRHLLAIRGFSGFFGLFGVYYSLQYLSLSDATVLTFLSPLTTAVAGCIFLGEAYHRKEALAGLLSLVGVVLIARPMAIFGSHHLPAVSDDADQSGSVTSKQRLIAVGVALLGVLGATGAYTSMRAIGKRAHTLHSMSYFSLWCVNTSATGMILLHQKVVFPTRIEWLALLLMIGIFGFLAQALLTMGLQRETAGRGSLAIYVQIIYATVLERIFFHTQPSALSIIGTLIIMGSAVYVALTKQTTQTPTPKTSESAESEAAAIDLELGVVDSEAGTGQSHGFLAQSNASRISFISQDGWKAPGEGAGLVGGLVGFKSTLDLPLSQGEPDGKTGRAEGDESVETIFDIGDGSPTPSSSSSTQIGTDLESDSDTDDDDDDDDDYDDDGNTTRVDEDKQRLLPDRG